jgi:hypothetical protein
MSDTPKKARRPSGSRNTPIKSDLASAFDAGMSEVESLKEEIEEWKSSLESNNMEHLPKYEELEECYSNLENGLDALQGLTIPDFLGDVEADYTQDTRSSARSRSARLDNATRALEAAKEAAEGWLEDHPSLEESTDPDEGEDTPTEVVTLEDVEEREGQRTEAEDAITEMDNALSELGNVSFPGMY